MREFRLLMTQQEIAGKAGISQQMVSYITSKVEITSLNSHFHLLELSTRYGSWISRPNVWIKV
jgi:hypothetical protein